MEPGGLGGAKDLRGVGGGETLISVSTSKLFDHGHLISLSLNFFNWKMGEELFICLMC